MLPLLQLEISMSRYLKSVLLGNVAAIGICFFPAAIWDLQSCYLQCHLYFCRASFSWCQAHAGADAPFTNFGLVPLQLAVQSPPWEDSTVCCYPTVRALEQGVISDLFRQLLHSESVFCELTGAHSSALHWRLEACARGEGWVCASSGSLALKQVPVALCRAWSSDLCRQCLQSWSDFTSLFFLQIHICMRSAGPVSCVKQLNATLHL